MIAFGKKFFLPQPVQLIGHGMGDDDIQGALQVVLDFGNQRAGHFADTVGQVLPDGFFKNELDAVFDPLQDAIRQALFQFVPCRFVLQGVGQIGQIGKNIGQYRIVVGDE